MDDRVLSPKNRRILELRRLIKQRKARSNERAFVAEGPTLVSEALSSPLHVSTVFAEETSELTDFATRKGAQVLLVQAGGVASAMSTVTPQPVVALVSFPEWGWEDLAGSGHVLVLDDLRDPGNVGTLLRTAEASGAEGVVLTGSCVDPHSPKVVRASAGSVFRIPFLVEPDRRIVKDELTKLDHPLMASVLDDSVGVYSDFELAGASIVLGNEASGLEAEMIGLCQSQIIIPLAGPTESLNVASAGSVFCFEALRQRREAGQSAEAKTS